MKRAVAAPHMTEGMRQDIVHSREVRVTDKYLTGCLSHFGALIAIVKEYAVAVVTASGSCRSARRLFLAREPAAEAVFGRSSSSAVLDENVGTAYAEHSTCAVEVAASYGQTAVVKSCHTVVSGAEYTVLHQNIVTGADVKAVMSAEYSQIACRDILAVLDSVRPVGAVTYRIARKRDTLAVPEVYSVRASVVFLTFGVKAVLPIDNGISLTDDGNIMCAYRAYNSIVPTAEGLDRACGVAIYRCRRCAFDIILGNRF